MYFRTTGRVTLEHVHDAEYPSHIVTVMLAVGTLLWVSLKGIPDPLGRVGAISIHPDGAPVSRHHGSVHPSALLGTVEPLGGAEADEAERLIWGHQIGPPHPEVTP